MRRSIPLAIAVVSLLALMQDQPCRADGPLDALLARVPAQANTILVIDVPALHKSPLGLRENWSKKHERNYTEGVASIPPSAERVIAAGQLNPTTLNSAWESVLIESPKSISEEQLARAVSGAPDKIAGQSIVLGRNNSYYTLLTPKIVGNLRPANRPGMARWLRLANDRSKP